MVNEEEYKALDEFIQEDIVGTANEWVGQGRFKEAAFLYTVSEFARELLDS